MASRRFNPNLVKVHRSYTAGELALRFGVHKNTVRNWQREGLKSLDQSRPALFQGNTVREFLRARNTGRRSPCGPGRLYCLRCRASQAPAGGMVDFVPLNPRSGNLRALCGTCGGLMHRRASLTALAAVMPGIEVQIARTAGQVGQAA